jgi:hypothetical protein
MNHWISVAVQTPAHSSVAGPLTYRSELPLPPGTLVRAPLGSREVLGIVWSPADGPPDGRAAEATRTIAGALEGIEPLSAPWLELVAFAAGYYQRALGELALAALPGPFLLFGTTGSGKTEVYMRAAARVLAAEPDAQVLVLVPEINLTPQLLARFAARFRDAAVVSLHSGLTPAQRLAAWLAAHSGRARIVLGTRMAVLASLPGLKLIVVDEEHDPSYKQQEGARYSARDLARVPRQAVGAKVLLGSATPSLESWHASTPAPDGPGRYQRLADTRRAGDRRGRRSAGRPAARAPRRHERASPRARVFAPPLLDGHWRASGAGRADIAAAQPARLRTGAALRRLRLEERVPALQRLPRVPQDRPHAALPPLRLHATRAARLPGLRQPRHRHAGPRHRAARGAPGRAAGRGTPARWHAGAHRPHRRRHHARQGRSWRPAWRRCTRARSTCWSARR